MSSIWEETFKSWYEAPSLTEKLRCENTVKEIRKAIDASEELSDMKIKIIPQGSFYNRTNVRQNSDVDIAVVLETTFYPRYPLGKTKEHYGNIDGSISYQEFKRRVGDALSVHFGAGKVIPGRKAFDIHSTVDADVIAGFHHRYYPDHGQNIWIKPEGFGFLDQNGKVVINWPEQTYDNGVKKNDETGERYKGVIRILKRLRNDMQSRNIDGSEDVASFLIESLVWNVDKNFFQNNLLSEDVKQIILNSYQSIDSNSNLYEVNGIKPLFADTQPWDKAKAKSFLYSAWNYLDFKQ